MNEIASATQLRKPRLTDQLLGDLPEAISTIQDNVDYLRDAVTQSVGTPTLHAKLKTRLTKLERSHEWLSRFHAAVSAQREAGVSDEETVE